ncbi:hypothetical protein [Pseudoruegeria sp. SHC-113]|uniref:COG3904 family protein n=1 Tax=Pseudoruegeria sp. SHC-113 TaxID=2855439 RepID=UPI0021BB46C3|nr:hypothetical protein [Pseudoruegeria sp. SHC-113]MCT8159937.1 hypothetical protein [Pseudoruegeria sp. SHC-113]
MKAFSFLLRMLLCLACASAASAQSAEHPNYPVTIIDRDEGIIAIVDEIDIRTPLAFERTLAEVPNVSSLILSSPGGLVHSALSIASRVHGLQLTTVVFEGHECMSACALIFLAGSERQALGDLGVHQISNALDGEESLVSGQFALADVIEALNGYNVPPEVVGLMLRTPPDDMYVFSETEKQRFGLLTGHQTATPKPSSHEAHLDLSDPDTWRGKMIIGSLISNGDRWYARLNSDGTTTFQFTSGKRSYGSYYIADGQICFLLDENPVASCRRPVRAADGVRWYDEAGVYRSIILSVENKGFEPVAATSHSAFEISEHIPPGECALVVASRSTEAAAADYVRENITDLRYLKAFRAKNGWIAITIGTLKPHEVDPVMSEWKAVGRIPSDSYCSTGANYLTVVELDLR